MDTNNRNSLTAGFTLTEILITLSIFAILSLGSITVFSNISSTANAKEDFNEITQALQYSRELAATTNKVISLCPNSNNKICGKNWQSGFIVFNDANENGSRETSEQIYQIFKPLKLAITYKGFPTSAFIQFKKNGQALTNGTFYIVKHSLSGFVTDKIILNQSGYYHEQQN